jgi:hypothetical protein
MLNGVLRILRTGARGGIFPRDMVPIITPRHVVAVPQRLIGGKAYDSDPLDARLRQLHGIEIIAPNRRKRRKTLDGRPLRRYVRRRKIERLFAWLKNFR